MSGPREAVQGRDRRELGYVLMGAPEGISLSSFHTPGGSSVLLLLLAGAGGGHGEGTGHYRMGFAVPTAPGQPNTSASLISLSLVSAICPLVKQAPSPIPNRNIRLFFPSEKSFQHLHLLKAPASMTSAHPCLQGNWKKLCRRVNWSSRNDTETLFFLSTSWLN